MTKDTLTKKGADNSANQKGQGKSKHDCMTESKRLGRSDNNTKDKFHCMLHGPNPTHNTNNCLNLKKYVEKLKKEKPCQNNSHKIQEEMQKKVADKHQGADCDRSAREQELNKFSHMSLEQKSTMDVEDKEF